MDLPSHIRAKRIGPNKWMAHCPCHNDKKRSLLISLGRSGKPMYKCFADCSWKDIRDAIEGGDKRFNRRVVL